MSTVEWYAHAIQCESPLSGLDLSGIFQTYVFVSPELNKYQLIFEVLKCVDLQEVILKQILSPLTAYIFLDFLFPFTALAS